jgi:hypothetical protein
MQDSDTYLMILDEGQEMATSDRISLWPRPWKPLPFPSGWLGQVESLEAELRSELCSGHPLFQLSCRVIGWNAEDPNEFLFATDDPKIPIAFVHLTWKTEQDPNWPYTVGYPCWDAFRSAWATEDA